SQWRKGSSEWTPVLIICGVLQKRSWDLGFEVCERPTRQQEKRHNRILLHTFTDILQSPADSTCLFIISRRVST
ncbi:mCG144919, partial [Mus musculus]